MGSFCGSGSVMNEALQMVGLRRRREREERRSGRNTGPGSKAGVQVPEMKGEIGALRPSIFQARLLCAASPPLALHPASCR